MSNLHSDRDLESTIQEIQNNVWSLAKLYEDDVMVLLSILRTLEKLHRQVREEIFEPSLPSTRSALYQLLRDIEESGGWPYIERMKLQDFSRRLLAGESQDG